MKSPKIFSLAAFVLLIGVLMISGCDRRVGFDAAHGQASAPQAAAVASSARASSAPSAVIANKFLQRFPATYDYDGVLNDPEIKRLLRNLLGDKFEHMRKTMSQLRHPIDVIAGDLVLYGHRNDSGAGEQAVICISFYPLTVHAVIYSGSDMTVYSPVAEYKYLPRCIQEWVYLNTRDTRDIDQPPPQGGSEFTFAHKLVAPR